MVFNPSMTFENLSRPFTEVLQELKNWRMTVQTLKKRV
jgi:hypothetical protein